MARVNFLYPRNLVDKTLSVMNFISNNLATYDVFLNEPLPCSHLSCSDTFREFTMKIIRNMLIFIIQNDSPSVKIFESPEHQMISQNGSRESFATSKESKDFLEPEFHFASPNVHSEGKEFRPDDLVTNEQIAGI